MKIVLDKFDFICYIENVKAKYTVKKFIFKNSIYPEKASQVYFVLTELKVEKPFFILG